MDAAELRAKALAARRFEHVEGEWTLTLLTPTRRDAMQLAHDRGLRLIDQAVAVSALVLLYYALAERCIVGWSGLRERDVLPGGGEAPLPWSEDAVRLWADAHPALAQRLGEMLYQRGVRHAEALEAAAKN